MLLSVKEMEVLCIYHAGSLSATLEVLEGVISVAPSNQRVADMKSLVNKLSRISEEDTVCLAFDIAK